MFPTPRTLLGCSVKEASLIRLGNWWLKRACGYLSPSARGYYMNTETPALSLPHSASHSRGERGASWLELFAEVTRWWWTKRREGLS